MGPSFDSVSRRSESAELLFNETSEIFRLDDKQAENTNGKYGVHCRKSS